MRRLTHGEAEQLHYHLHAEESPWRLVALIVESRIAELEQKILPSTVGRGHPLEEREYLRTFAEIQGLRYALAQPGNLVREALEGGSDA